VAWATTVAFYEVRNFQRLAGRARLEFDDELLALLAAERAQDVPWWSPRMEALAGCVEKLDPAQRLLVESVYEQGAEIADLARRQGRVPQTLYNQLGSIRRALAECVQRRLAGASP